MWIKLKGKANWIYIASLLLYAEGAQAWFTEFYLQNTPYLALPRNRLPDGITTDCGGRHLSAVYVLTY